MTIASGFSPSEWGWRGRAIMATNGNTSRSLAQAALGNTSIFMAWANFAMLALESQQVVALRLMKLAAGGPAALREMNLMTFEKLEALAHESGHVLSGASHASVVKRYRKRVRSNRRRLLK